MIVHAVNPWGMANIRRVNANNVDLNRNFMESEGDFLEDFNQAYRSLDTVLNPNHPLRPFWLEFPGLLYSVLTNLYQDGIKDLRGAVLLGQQNNSAGLYYSGEEYQLETQLMMRLIEECLVTYPKVILLDMHTGYGPRFQMSLICSPEENRSPEELETLYRYPLVVQANPDQFYRMKGDMVDWAYKFKKTKYPKADFFGTGFEFGVYGDGILNEIRSLKTMIYENQAFRNGVSSPVIGRRIKKELFEMYLPDNHKWKEKALADCRQALNGILTEEKFLLY
jgi:hypothetical protein